MPTTTYIVLNKSEKKIEGQVEKLMKLLEIKKRKRKKKGKKEKLSMGSFLNLQKLK